MPFNASACTPEVVEGLGAMHWTWFQASVLTYVGFSIVLILALICLNHILRGMSTSKPNAPSPSQRVTLNTKIPIILRRQSIVAFIYVIAMTALSAIATASMSKTMYLSTVTGCWSGLTPGKWYAVVDRLASYMYVFVNWGADGLLVWRCWVIYRCSSQAPIWASLALPLILYSSVIGMGIFFMVPSVHGQPGSRLHELVYSSLTLFLNVLTTAMIVLRLLVYRYRITAILGKAQGAHYVSYVTILVESAGLVVVSNLLLLVAMQSESSLQIVAFQGNLQVQVIAPLLILVRVLQGKTWSPREDLATVGSIHNGNTATMRWTANADLETPTPRPNRRRNSLSAIIRFDAYPLQNQNQNGEDVEEITLKKLCNVAPEDNILSELKTPPLDQA